LNLQCFHDVQRPQQIKHEVVMMLVGQRVFAIALGYEDLNDHDELRYDPVLGRRWGSKLEAADAGSNSSLRRSGHARF
jgi:hypothetical protein